MDRHKFVWNGFVRGIGAPLGIVFSILRYFEHVAEYENPWSPRLIGSCVALLFLSMIISYLVARLLWHAKTVRDLLGD